MTNALSTGGQAVPQAIAVSFAGYFFYLIRRASGGNVLNSILHGMFDFSILTGTAIVVDQQAYVGSAFAIFAYVIIAVVVIARRKHIEPAETPIPLAPCSASALCPDLGRTERNAARECCMWVGAGDAAGAGYAASQANHL